MECYIINPVLSLSMKHLVIGQRQKAPNFSAFHWSPHGSLVSIGQHFVTTRVVHLPKKTETSLFTESDQRASNHQLCIYAPPVQPGPIRTRLCGPCIAAIAGYGDRSRSCLLLIVIEVGHVCCKLPTSSPARGEIFSAVNGVLLHTAFYYHLSIVLKWLV